ncbi:MAG: hypothetical protein HPKKFMNG_01946 [Planctomycetes bacterium]|nr:hypothetical protein [Planctomycetota bacterium]
MRIFWLLIAALGLATLAARPQAQDARVTLASELVQVRESWLERDDAQAEVRARALSQDPRVKGELSRWYASFSTALRAKANDARAADSLRPFLAVARDARAYVRATRLLLVLGLQREALALVREAKSRHGDSRTLMRLEAELVWLCGDMEASLAAYAEMAAVSGARFPYEISAVAQWEQVEPWAESGEFVDTAPKPDAPSSRRRPPQPMGKVEPFVSLCTSPVWFATEIPGYERLLAEAARDTKRVDLARQRLEDRLQELKTALGAVDAAKGGLEERSKLEAGLHRARFAALTEVRIAALADLAAGRATLAEALARRGLALARGDCSLLDLLVQALAAQGKAEEARAEALVELNRNEGLKLVNWPGALQGSMLQAYDRVFEAARVLSRANMAAAKTQLESLRSTMGSGEESTSLDPGNLGLWLLQKGEMDLALQYLEEASRTQAVDSGPGVPPDWELALFTLKLPLAEKSDAAEPWLELAARAGALRAQSVNYAAFITGINAQNIYFYRREDGLTSAMRGVKQGAEAVLRLQSDFHLLLASRLKAADLDALLKPDGAESRKLAQLLEQYAALIEQARSASDWEVRERAGLRTMPVVSALEGRALLLRARFAQAPAKTLPELAAWLAANQTLLDPRATFKSVQMAEQEVRLEQQRAAAGVPEVHHGGLLLDAALALARAGRFADAGQLLLLNPAPCLDLEGVSRRMFLASLFFHKAGLPELAARARLSLPGRGQASMAHIELAAVRPLILEFGTRQDLLAYVRDALATSLRGYQVEVAHTQTPELKEAPPGFWLEAPLAEIAAGIFASTLRNGSTSQLAAFWPKLLATPDSAGIHWRLAIWAVICDQPAQQRWDASGQSAAQDFLNAWQFVAQALSLKASGTEARAAVAALRAQLQRCGGSVALEDEGGTDVEEYYPE